MPYITMRDSPHYTQISLEDLLNGYVDESRFTAVRNAPSSTRTYFCNRINTKLEDGCDVSRLVSILNHFTTSHASLYEQKRETLYRHFEIPKTHPNPQTGIYDTRPIDAPNDELKAALYELKTILETEFHALYHTSAFAYIPHRCTIDAVRRHQANQSWWFLKTDFSNFFGNTTPEFAHNMLRMIYPFSELYKYPAGEDAIRKALDLCFLNGGLPQGTPISPMLTNLLMIPIDHRLSNTLTSFQDGKHYVYTRYADDMLISSKYQFQPEEITEYISSVLREFQAPFSIKNEKTRMGSRNGHNANLGVILNAENEITIGHKKKEAFRGMLSDYVRAKQTGENWSLHEIQTMNGLLSYYSKIEPEFWERTINRMNQKYHCDIKHMIHDDICGGI